MDLNSLYTKGVHYVYYHDFQGRASQGRGSG